MEYPTWHIVVEADGVARYWIEYTAQANTYSGPGVSLLSEDYINGVIADNGLTDIPAALAHLGITDELDYDTN